MRFLLLLYIFFLPVYAFSQSGTGSSNILIGFDEKQGQYAAPDTRLINENGDTVLFGDLLGKPTILNLVYFRCPGTCSPLMWGIAKFIEDVDLKLGTDYQVLTISFDHTEDIRLGVQKKASYVNTLKNKELGKSWHFFVSDSLNIAKLAGSVGFNFKWITNQYAHPTGLIALAPDGKITRYLRGIEFLPFDIKITMVEAAGGRIGPSINRLLAVCYDERGNDLVFNVTKVAGILIIFFSFVLFLILFLYKRTIKR
jgi:protein SCO1/2